MIWVWPGNSYPPVDTRTAPIAYLAGILRYLNRHGASKNVFPTNGGSRTLARICTAVRVRFQLDKREVPRSFLALLNTLDPPPCRCGRKGTRIIGARTFCMRCGPTAVSIRNVRRLHATYDERIEREHEQAERDARTLKARALHQTKAGHK